MDVRTLRVPSRNSRVKATPGGPVTETDSELRDLPEPADAAGFMDLFWRHGPAVHAYLARRTNRQHADDLLGEVWLRAFRGRGSYDRRWPDARPWLYGIARNVLRAHWRSAGRSDGVGVESMASDPWPETDNRLDAAAMLDTFRQVLATLSDAEREVLFLVTWEQLTPAETALVLGIPQGTARSRLHRALSALRSELELDPKGSSRADRKEN
jgi:RNA polymerase sigma-70 factor (ECF subfamily)